MKKKKILIHGTADSLQQFFADKVSNDFEIVALLSEENIFGNFEVVTPQNLPKFVYKMIDGIIFTDANTNAPIIDFLLEQNFELRKIILWDAAKGWQFISVKDEDSTENIYFCGLEFHIRNENDIKFFKEINSYLQGTRQLKNVSTQKYPEILTQFFQLVTRQPLDLTNPKTFTEKLQWLKLFNATPIKSRLADKFAVRSWIAEKIGSEYLIPLLGVWNDFDDINFDDLPNQFILKCNHGSGMNIIVHDKNSFDVQNAREKINAWLAIDFATGSLELHYTRIDRKIIAEKYIENMREGVIDYKFHCFNGTPKFIQVIGDRNFAKHTRYQKFCDLNYNDIGAMFEDYPHFPYDVPRVCW